MGNLTPFSKKIVNFIKEHLATTPSILLVIYVYLCGKRTRHPKMIPKKTLVELGVQALSRPPQAWQVWLAAFPKRNTPMTDPQAPASRAW